MGTALASRPARPQLTAPRYAPGEPDSLETESTTPAERHPSATLSITP
ncbi:MAG: hypothetical protein AB8G96_10250 [Phycisphaerales bacterium]